MSRYIATLTFAAGLSFVVAAAAQESTVKSTTKTSGNIKTVTYTGCVQSAPQTRTYILDKVVPVSRTESVGTSGATSTVTTYALVPGEKVQIEEHVGRKVEVTGMIIPAGDAKSETKTKVEREGAPDSKTKETVKSEGAMPRFQVTSIKSLGESCN